MSSLRDALEKLAGELEYDSSDGGRKVRELIAAHPAESAPCSVIDREAVARILGDVRALPCTSSINPHIESVMELVHDAAAEPVGVSDELTSLGLTRSEIRDEVDELIRNAYYEAWREARRRPDAMAPGLEIDWTQPGGVRITELWCVCDVQGSALSASCKVHGGGE